MLPQCKIILDAFKLYVYLCVGLEKYMKSPVHLVRVYLPCEEDLDMASRKLHKSVMQASASGPEGVDSDTLREFFEDDPTRVEYAIQLNDLDSTTVVFIVEVGKEDENRGLVKSAAEGTRMYQGLIVRDDPRFVRIGVMRGPLMSHVAGFRLQDGSELKQEEEEQHDIEGMGNESSILPDRRACSFRGSQLRLPLGFQITKQRRYRLNPNTFAV